MQTVSPEPPSKLSQHNQALIHHIPTTQTLKYTWKMKHRKRVHGQISQDCFCFNPPSILLWKQYTAQIQTFLHVNDIL